MNYTNTIKISVKALKRNKFRSFLTMLGIIIGVASVIVMLAIGQGSKKSIRDQMSGMGTNLIMVMPASQQRGGVMMGNCHRKRMFGAFGSIARSPFERSGCCWKFQLANIGLRRE
jgi:putative ABC transport system permease protein